MVAQKYFWLARLHPLCQYSPRQHTPEVREVVYSQAENKTLYLHMPRAPLGSKSEVPLPPISPPDLTDLTINQKRKKKNCFSSSFTQRLTRYIQYCITLAAYSRSRRGRLFSGGEKMNISTESLLFFPLLDELYHKVKCHHIERKNN